MNKNTAVCFLSQPPINMELCFAKYLKITGREDIPMPAIEKTTNGKPHFVDSDICFSLSHSGKYALIGFSENPIGVDIEEHREVDYEKITKRFFPDEIKKIKTQNDFFDLFTQKEASIKCLGSTLAKGIRAEPVNFTKNLQIIDGFSIAVASDVVDFYVCLV